MVAAAKQKKASNNSTESPRKDFSKLYKKKIAPITIPIKVPSMGLDVELEYTPPTEEVEALLDRYIIAVASSNPENPGNAAAPSDEYWLKAGKRQLLDLAVYIKKIGAKQKAEELVEETGGVKTPELVDLRSRMVKAIAELDAALEPKFEEYEKLSFYMVSDSNALDILHNCIALCFQEFEEPEQLEDQVKFFLIMSLLSITGRVLAM